MYNINGVLVNDEAFEYLKLERGDLAHLRHDPAMWIEMYSRYTLEVNAQMISVNAKARRVLDIGSGLGVTDVMFAKQFGAHITLLDGEDAPPRVIRQDVPFLSRDVIARYMKDNGIENYSYMSPSSMTADKFDLILSFRAWCFHFSPSVYLKFVVDCCATNADLIIDMRRERPEWERELTTHFTRMKTIADYRKCERVHFKY